MNNTEKDAREHCSDIPRGYHIYETLDGTELRKNEETTGDNNMKLTVELIEELLTKEEREIYDHFHLGTLINKQQSIRNLFHSLVLCRQGVNDISEVRKKYERLIAEIYHHRTAEGHCDCQLCPYHKMEIDSSWLIPKSSRT